MSFYMPYLFLTFLIFMLNAPHTLCFSIPCFHIRRSFIVNPENKFLTKGKKKKSCLAICNKRYKWIEKGRVLVHLIPFSLGLSDTEET